MTLDLPIPVRDGGQRRGGRVSAVLLALLGDGIVAGESAYFLQAFRRIGLIPDGGSTWLLPRHDRPRAGHGNDPARRTPAGGQGAGMGPDQPLRPRRAS